MEYLKKFVTSPETRRLLFALVLFFGVPTMVFGLVGGYATKTIWAEFRTELEIAAARASDTVDRNLFERYGDVQAFGLNSVVLDRESWYKQGSENAIARRINQYIDTYDLYYLSIFVDTDGKVIAVNDRDSDGNAIDTRSIYAMNLASTEWFQALKSGRYTQRRAFTAQGNDVSTGTYIEEVAKDHLVNSAYHNIDGLSIGFSSPVFGDKGEVIGYWTNRAKFTVVDQILRATRARLVALGRKEASVSLISSTGTVLLRVDPGDKEGKFADVTSAHAVAPFSMSYSGSDNSLIAAAKDKARGAGEFVDSQGEEHIGGFSHLVGALGYPGMDWFVLVTVPKATPGSSLLDLVKVFTATIWGLVVLAVPAAFWLLRKTLNAEMLKAELEAKQSDASRAVRSVQVALNELASGNTNAIIEERFEGELEEMKENVNRISRVLTAFNAELSRLALAAREGDLSRRADASGFKGGYAEVVSGVNDIVDAILTPVAAIRESLGRVARGDLTAYITEQYRGDHAAIVDSLNATLDGLNRLLGQVRGASDQISTGSTQVASAAQDLSQGASEQAATVEEISAQMGQITTQTQQNAENANQANLLAVAARDGARAGDHRMNEMLVAMREIEEASTNISKIIKVIDEIAFQTNLLALNAAVEAARAGVHGKGFAVVAEEVSNLAARSARAAKETTSMIEGSIAKVGLGTSIAKETASALGAIVQDVGKVTDLVAEIAAASSEQADGIHQINAGLDQVNQVTQRNTATAEECAASAEETSGQVVEMQRMLSTFTLREGAGLRGISERMTPEMMTLVQAYVERLVGGRGVGATEPPPPHKKAPGRLGAASVIALDSGDFGKY